MEKTKIVYPRVLTHEGYALFVADQQCDRLTRIGGVKKRNSPNQVNGLGLFQNKIHRFFSYQVICYFIRDKP